MQANAQPLRTLPSRPLQLQARYENLLIMYGEKAEELEEMRMDIHDLKSVYRQQTQQLVTQIAELEAQKSSS